MGTKCGATRGYRRREPEDTVLYRVLAEYLETFLAGAGQGNGMRSGLPRFVERELRGFLDCGILARGFCRVHCTACGRDALVAFSCKRRGFCPACGTRRMVDTAAHLADRVFPEVPVRQWVLALPYRIRFLCAYDPGLCRGVRRIFVRAVASFYKAAWSAPAKHRPGSVNSHCSRCTLRNVRFMRSPTARLVFGKQCTQ